MKKIFDETRPGAVLSGCVDIIWAGILWLVCSLPVITAGPASAALYYCIVKSVRHERENLTKSFFSAFVSDFKISLIFWLVYLAVIVPMLFVPGLIPFYILPVGLTLPWVFSYISRFDSGIKGTGAAVLRLAVQNVFRSLALAAILFGTLAAAWLLPILTPLLPGFVCLLMSYIIEPVLRTISEQIDNDENKDRWYNE